MPFHRVANFLSAPQVPGERDPGRGSSTFKFSTVSIRLSIDLPPKLGYCCSGKEREKDDGIRCMVDLFPATQARLLADGSCDESRVPGAGERVDKAELWDCCDGIQGLLGSIRRGDPPEANSAVAGPRGDHICAAWRR